MMSAYLDWSDWAGGAKKKKTQAPAPAPAPGAVGGGAGTTPPSDIEAKIQKILNERIMALYSTTPRPSSGDSTSSMMLPALTTARPRPKLPCGRLPCVCDTIYTVDTAPWNPALPPAPTTYPPCGEQGCPVG